MLYEFISPTKPTKLCFDIERYNGFISPYNINEVWEKLVLYTIGYYELSIEIYESIYCFQDTTKFNDDECLKKWKNIVLSCGEKQKDIFRIMYFMKHIAINVLHESIYDLFDKKTMLVCMGEKMVVKKEYSQYAIDTLNRFWRCYYN